MSDDTIKAQEVTRERLVDFLWEHSYKRFLDGDIGAEYDWYPEYLADRMLEAFWD